MRFWVGALLALALAMPAIAASNASAALIFSEPPGSPFPVGINPWKHTVGDFSGDGVPDVVVSRDTDLRIQTLLGDGEGGFASGQSFASPGATRHIRIAELTGDGILDVGLIGVEGVQILRGVGDGSLVAGPRQGRGGQDGAFADFDGDGDLDVATTMQWDLPAVQILGNDGTGVMTTVAAYDAVDVPRLAVGDVDADGEPDLLAAGWDTSRTLYLYKGGPGLTFNDPVTTPNVSRGEGLALADMNDDGRADAITTLENRVQVRLSDGSGQFGVITSSVVTYPDRQFFTVADVDGDLKLDLVVTPQTAQRVYFLRGTGLGGFLPAETWTAPDNLWGPQVADLDLDGDRDITILQRGEDALGVLLQETVPDRDADGVPDSLDNCAGVANPAQQDLDGDGSGDVCDDDRDGDGSTNDGDNCPDQVNPGQEDLDDDGTGDVCDADRDGDGVVNGADNCADVANADQLDDDSDGIGDACDTERAAPHQIAVLIETVEGLDLNPGIGGSLTAKLQRALEAANAGDRDRACRMIASFVREVTAQAGRHLTEGEASMLLDRASRVSATLGCGA